MAGKWIPPKLGPSIDKNNFYLILFSLGRGKYVTINGSRLLVWCRIDRVYHVVQLLTLQISANENDIRFSYSISLLP